MEFCSELFMDDVARFDFIRASDCKLSVPFGVANISEIQGCTFYTDYTDSNRPQAASLTFGKPVVIISRVGGDAMIGDTPQHKVTAKREAYGHVRVHSLQIPIYAGFQTLREIEKSIKGVDFNVIVHTIDGTRYLAYGLPNSSDFSIEEQMGSSATMTVKASLSSMSGFIRLQGMVAL